MLNIAGVEKCLTRGRGVNSWAMGRANDNRHQKWRGRGASECGMGGGKSGKQVGEGGGG